MDSEDTPKYNTGSDLIIPHTVYYILLLSLEVILKQNVPNLSGLYTKAALLVLSIISIIIFI